MPSEGRVLTLMDGGPIDIAVGLLCPRLLGPLFDDVGLLSRSLCFISSAAEAPLTLGLLRLGISTLDFVGPLCRGLLSRSLCFITSAAATPLTFLVRGDIGSILSLSLSISLSLSLYAATPTVAALVWEFVGDRELVGVPAASCG